jgi:hypothetical protein
MLLIIWVIPLQPHRIGKYTWTDANWHYFSPAH